jgi:hypothetical protein
MTICALIVCSLVAGTGQCDRTQPPELIDYPAITRAVDCQQFGAFIRSGGLPIPGNYRLMRVEMIKAPQTQTATQTAKGTER